MSRYLTFMFINPMLNNFCKNWLFIVGAQRCGTTSLVNFLMQFPEVEFVTPTKPEPRLLLAQDKMLLEAWDSKQSNAYILCDKSTSYIEFPEVASIIDENFRAAKVIVMVRDPVQRAISNYFFTKKHGLEQRALEEAIFSDNNLKISYSTSVSPFAYIERGFYINYIIPFIEKLGMERVHISVLENLIAEEKSRDELISFLQFESPGQSVEFLRNNEAKRHEDVPLEVINRLADIYRHTNHALQEMFEIDIKRWHS